MKVWLYRFKSLPSSLIRVSRDLVVILILVQRRKHPEQMEISLVNVFHKSVLLGFQSFFYICCFSELASLKNSFFQRYVFCSLSGVAAATERSNPCDWDGWKSVFSVVSEQSSSYRDTGWHWALSLSLIQGKTSRASPFVPSSMCCFCLLRIGQDLRHMAATSFSRGWEVRSVTVTSSHVPSENPGF